ncbi:hypothetical protein SNEBB_006412 [Seison nebaliae]|nr:hypothetical protein SNEBB_006412 [Seison nebaliae]
MEIENVPVKNVKEKKKKNKEKKKKHKNMTIEDYFQQQDKTIEKAKVEIPKIITKINVDELEAKAVAAARERQNQEEAERKKQQIEEHLSEEIDPDDDLFDTDNRLVNNRPTILTTTEKEPAEEKEVHRSLTLQKILGKNTEIWKRDKNISKSESEDEKKEETVTETVIEKKEEEKHEDESNGNGDAYVPPSRRPGGYVPPPMPPLEPQNDNVYMAPSKRFGGNSDLNLSDFGLTRARPTQSKPNRESGYVLPHLRNDSTTSNVDHSDKMLMTGIDPVKQNLIKFNEGKRREFMDNYHSAKPDVTKEEEFPTLD